MSLSADELKLRAAKVRAELQQDVPKLLDALGIKGRMGGAILQTANPRRADSKKDHFTVWLTGPGAGSWVDYGGADKGDVYDLIRYLAKLDKWIDAYRWALRFLNLPEDGPAPRSAAQAKVDAENLKAAQAARDLQQAHDDKAQAAKLFRWWTGLPPITGTVVETYLREAREIPLQKIGSPKHRLGALRYANRLEHMDDRTGELTYWPAMVAVMVDGPQARGLHRTWLRPDGRGKADVHGPRKMLGRTRGAAIRLTTGSSGYSPTLAVKKGITGPLAIGEGIETSLTVAAAMPDWRVWAAGSLAHMAAIEWPECASRVILLRDNDWGEQARLAFDRATIHWLRQARGRRLDVAESELGNDFNDWLQGAA